MKPITHAQKELMLEYFRVLESQLRSALQEAAETGSSTAEPGFIEPLAKSIEARVAAIGARVPAATAPSLQQIRKNLETVLDPAFFDGAPGTPLKAAGVLREQLRHHKVYTPPEGGGWSKTAPRPRGAGGRGKRGGSKARRKA